MTDVKCLQCDWKGKEEDLIEEKEPFYLLLQCPECGASNVHNDLVRYNP